MVDISSNPRVNQLLGRAESTTARRDAAAQGSAAWVDLDRQVEDAYRELGRYVHWLLRQDRSSLKRIREEADQYQRRLAEMRDILVDDPAELRQPLPDVLVEPQDLDDPLPMVEAELLDRDDYTDATQAQIPIREGSPLDVVLGLHGSGGMDDTAAGVTIEGLARDRVVQDVATQIEWVRTLKELLSIVGAPREITAQQALAIQATRLLNATTGMEVRWLDFPESVQITLIGYLGSYARQVAGLIESDVEIGLTLSRLSRYQEARKMTPLLALDPDSEPEYETWAQDCQRWWQVLSPGLGV